MDTKLIIYPTDFSDCANNALSYVLGIAQSMKCKIQLVHIVDMGSRLGYQEHPDLYFDEIELFVKKSKNQLKKLKNTIESYEIECDHEVLKGSVNVLLTKYIKEKDPYLVVMGTTGSSEIENKIMGSLTYKVIKNVRSPVFAVPKNASYKGFQKIVFATDCQKKDLIPISYVVKLARPNKGIIDLVHVLEEELKNETEEFILSGFEKEIFGSISYKKLNFRLLYWKDIEGRLNLLVEKLNADLLVLVTRKLNFIDRLFRKSLTKKMIYHSDIPLLIFH